MSNSGFVDVATVPAAAVSRTLSLGTFAALAGPTVATDGTVFLGTREGTVIALHADGRGYWDRQLADGETIVTSPAVGSDGSVYVVGVRERWGEYTPRPPRDHRARVIATLYRFGPPGDMRRPTAFPLYERLVLNREEGPMGLEAIGAPNIWRFGNDEAIIVPALYSNMGGVDVHLLAFSPDGGIMGDWTMYLDPGDVTGDWTDIFFWAVEFDPGVAQPFARPSIPGVAIGGFLPEGTPSIVYVDRWNQATIAFTFCVGESCSPAPGFTERVRRSHAPRNLWSSATILANNHSIVGTDDGVVFGVPGVSDNPPITGLNVIHATPTVSVDGQTVIVNDDAEVITLRGPTVTSRMKLPGHTIARAAASRTHVFIATTDGLHTLDAKAAARQVTFPWAGGGIWSPAVGPGGHVYAMADNVLFVFPPPDPLRPDVHPWRDL